MILLLSILLIKVILKYNKFYSSSFIQQRKETKKEKLNYLNMNDNQVSIIRSIYQSVINTT